MKPCKQCGSDDIQLKHKPCKPYGIDFDCGELFFYQCRRCGYKAMSFPSGGILVNGTVLTSEKAKQCAFDFWEQGCTEEQKRADIQSRMKGATK